MAGRRRSGAACTPEYKLEGVQTRRPTTERRSRAGAYQTCPAESKGDGWPGDFVLVDWLASGFGDQKYHAFAFDLAEDEVVIIESTVPRKCAYWAYQMVTDSWRAINPLKHQSSLNPDQAHLDKDGKFRAVISASDPGVKNWLDTGGASRALVYSRYNGCDEVPMPTAKAIKKSQLDKALPTDTVHVSPQEREASLRERARMAQLRRRW